MNPTAEQQDIFSTFYSLYTAKQNRFVVDAGAGTGKTSTALALAKAFPDIFFKMLCFNKLNAEELNKRSSDIPNIKAMTLNKLAWDWASGFKSTHLMKTTIDVGWLKDNCVRGRIPHKEETSYAWKLNYALSGYFQQAEPDFVKYYLSTAYPDLKLIPMAQAYLDGVWPEEGQRDRNAYPISLEGTIKFMQLTAAQLFAEDEVLIVEEYQDINGIQAAFLEQQENFLMAIGDINQRIYSWRGGGALLKSAKSWPRKLLTQSFRVNPTDAKLANMILRELGDFQIEGLSSKKDISCKAKLFRTNKELIIESLLLMKEATPHSVAINLQDLWDNLWHIFNLKHNKPIAKSRASIRYIKTYHDYEEAVQNSEEIAGLEGLYEFMGQKGGLYKIQKELTAFFEKSHNSDFVLSTVNKAKGMEWDEVHLCNDILAMLLKKEAAVNGAEEVKDTKKAIKEYEEELRLLYVAVTRAKVKTFLSEKLHAYIQELGKAGKEKVDATCRFS